MTQGIPYYKRLLAISRHSLDADLELQPQVMEDITEAVAKANTRMVEAKDDLAKLEARLGDRIRSNDAKATVAAVDGAVRRDNERVKAFEKLQGLREEHERWLGLYEAWKQRGYSLKSLVELYAAQYFSRDSHTVRPGAEAPNRDDRRALREASGRSRQERAAEVAETSAKEAGVEPRIKRRVVVE